jgi:hypothetical protein
MCAKNAGHRAETSVCKRRPLLFRRIGKVLIAPKIEIASRAETCEWVN